MGWGTVAQGEQIPLTRKCKTVGAGCRRLVMPCQKCTSISSPCSFKVSIHKTSNDDMRADYAYMRADPGSRYGIGVEAFLSEGV